MPSDSGVTSEKQNIFDFAFEHRALDRCADRNDFVGVDAFVRFLAENFLDPLLDRRHTGHTANQDDFVNITGAESGVLQRLAARTFGAIDQVGAQRFELRPGQFHVQMLRSLLVRGDEGQIDIGFHRRGKLALGFFCRLFESLQRHAIFAQIDTLVFLELVGEIIDDSSGRNLRRQERYRRWSP